MEQNEQIMWQVETQSNEDFATKFQLGKILTIATAKVLHGMMTPPEAIYFMVDSKGFEGQDAFKSKIDSDINP